MTKRACIYTNNEKQNDKLEISQLGVTYYNWSKTYAKKKGKKSKNNK